MPTLPTIRLGLKLYLLLMVRKSELQDATWDEVDFENAVWSIPKKRMKRSSAQRPPVAAGARHISRAQDLRQKLQVPAAVALRRRRADVARYVQPCQLLGRPEGQGRRAAARAFTIHDLRRAGSPSCRLRNLYLRLFRFFVGKRRPSSSLAV